MPKLTHPDSKQTIECDDDAVPMYESQGWQRVTPRPRKAKRDA
jgi:hypothetical protein